MKAVKHRSGLANYFVFAAACLVLTASAQSAENTIPSESAWEAITTLALVFFIFLILWSWCVQETLAIRACRVMSVVACSLVASGIIGLASPWISALQDAVTLLASHADDGGLAIGIALLSGVAAWGLSRRGHLGCFTIRHSHRWLPLWMAVPLSLLILKQASVFPNVLDSSEDLLHLAWPLLGVLSGTWTARYIGQAPANPRSWAPQGNGDSGRNISVAMMSEDIEALYEWIRDDTPITHPAQDQCSHALVARRMARRLKQHRVESQNPEPTMDLHGKFGSGKSTILNLVEFYLHHPKELGARDLECDRVLICRVSIWGFDQYEMLLRHIFSELLKTVKAEVDCTSLLGTSSAIVSTLVSRPGWLGTFLAFFREPADADQALRNLSRLLIALNWRLVLWVEDMDRSHQDPKVVGHLSAVLTRLKQSPGLCFVLAGGKVATDA